MCRDPPEVPGELPRAQWGLAVPTMLPGGPVRGIPLLGASLVPPLWSRVRGAARAPPGAVFWEGTELVSPVVPRAPAEIKVYTGAVPAGCARG